MMASRNKTFKEDGTEVASAAFFGPGLWKHRWAGFDESGVLVTPNDVVRTEDVSGKPRAQNSVLGLKTMEFFTHCVKNMFLTLLLHLR